MKLTFREHNIKLGNKWLNNAQPKTKVSGKSEKYKKILYNYVKPKCYA